MKDIMETSVVIDRIEVVGSKVPYDLEIRGRINQECDSGDSGEIVRAMHDHGAEFQALVAEAFDRTILARLRDGGGEPAEIGDIEL